MTGGTSARPSSTSRSAWRLQRRWAIGRGKAGPRHLPHALERVRQSRRLPQRTTCLGNIAKVAHVQAHTALNMGVALMLHVRAARQAPTTGADQDKASGPPSHSSASACLNDRVREAAKWLQVAFDGGHAFAKLHLAHLTLMLAKRTRRWHISKSTSHGVCDGDVPLAPGVGKRWARTRRCSRAAVAV